MFFIIIKLYLINYIFCVRRRLPVNNAERLSCTSVPVHRRALDTSKRMHERDVLLQLSVDREGVRCL